MFLESTDSAIFVISAGLRKNDKHNGKELQQRLPIMVQAQKTKVCNKI